MGQCYARDFAVDNEDVGGDGVGDHDHRQFPSETSPAQGPLAARCSTGNPRPGHYPRSTPSGPLDTAKTHSPSRSTPWRRFFSRPFPPLSPAKHIKAALARRQGSRARSDHATDGDGSSGLAPEEKPLLDKNFGFGTNFAAKYELEKEIGRGHFGHTCSARVKKGDYKGQLVAVKIISKDKMTTAIAIEDVRREVMILKALSHHKNMTKLYDACEDSLNVYIVMELCEGGELLDRILWRGGRYAEEDAKVIIVQILNVIAFFHLQGVVHRDLKPENFLFTTTDEKAPVKIIDFGLSDFVKPDERLNDIVGSAYYVAPEVLHRSYGVEADIWSIGVISYILLCGSRPFWARTESGIFHSVLRDDPNLNESPWPFISPEAKDFVRRLLNKDYRKRMTAVQALTHPWLLDRHRQVPLDILIYKLVKSYIRVTPFKQAALKALSKALTETELIYIRSQFVLLEPNDDDHVSFENFRTALRRNATDAMKKSKVFDFLNALEPLLNRTMDFEDFCAATISPYQLEALENWGQISSAAFEYFEEEGNRAISVGELATEMNLTSVAHNMIRGWIRPTDGKLSFYGYTKFLHGVTIRNSSARQHR